MAVLDIVVEVMKHLPGKHNQMEHGRKRAGLRPDDYTKQIGPQLTYRKEEVSPKYLAKVKQAIKDLGAYANTISEYSLFKADKKEIYGGYFEHRNKFVAAYIFPTDEHDQLRFTLAHETGHGVQHAYPSLAKTFLTDLKQKHPEEWDKLRRYSVPEGIAKEEYPTEKQVRMEMFANAFAHATLFTREAKAGMPFAYAFFDKGKRFGHGKIQSKLRILTYTEGKGGKWSHE